MDDFSQKPKRKREGGKNPTMYLVSGIVIGVLVTAFLAAGFLFLGVSTGSQTFVLPPTLIPTATPVGFVPQSVPAQATVIAHRVNSARLSPNGRFLVTIVQEDINPVVYLSELAVQRNLVASQRYTIPSEGGYFTNAIFSPSSDKLVVTGESGRTIIVDTTTRQILEELSSYSHAAFNADGTLLALAGNGDGIRVLDANTMTLVAESALNVPWIGGLAYTANNQLLVANNNQLDLLTPSLDTVQASFTIDHTIFDIAVHPTSEWVAVASEGYVQVINLNTQERTHYAFETARIHSVAFSNDGTWLGAGGGDSGYGDGRLYAFRWNQGNVIPPDPSFYEVIEFTGNQHVVNDVAFTYDNLLLSAAWDGSVRLWDVTTGQEISRLQL